MTAPLKAETPREKLKTPAQHRREWTEKVSQPLVVGGLRLSAKGGTMKAGCWHRRKATGACAGCYARLFTFLWAIEGGSFGSEAKALAKECSEAMRRDKEASHD